MAIIKFGPMVVGARGTLAGTTFSANRAGPYAKGWARSSNPRSTLQQTQRGILGEFATLWRDLSTAEKDDWDDYADDAAQELTNSLGETYFISGFNWYVRINTHLTAAGAAPRDDAPTLTRLIAPTLETLNFRTTAGAGASSVKVAVGSSAIDEIAVIHSKLYNSLGRQSAPLVALLLKLGTPQVDRRVLLNSELATRYGTIQLGQKLFVEVSAQDDHGQRGPITTFNRDATT